jgi:hypothetical protein
VIAAHQQQDEFVRVHHGDGFDGLREWRASRAATSSQRVVPGSGPCAWMRRARRAPPAAAPGEFDVGGII